MRNINEESLNSLGQVAKNILEILHLDSVLDAQDEEDRKGISLWGFEDKNNRYILNCIFCLVIRVRAELYLSIQTEYHAQHILQSFSQPLKWLV